MLGQVTYWTNEESFRRSPTYFLGRNLGEADLTGPREDLMLKCLSLYHRGNITKIQSLSSLIPLLKSITSVSEIQLFDVF